MVPSSSVLISRLVYSVLLFSFDAQVFGQNANSSATVCADNGSDWYTDFVGETPCATYQRLRQVCSSQYELGILDTTAIPGDDCSGESMECCCNSISFALSMLCMTCQRGLGPSEEGYDALSGSYGNYLKTSWISVCSPVTNQKLPSDIQEGVCDNRIRIFDNLYSLFWDDGSWS
ncbi:hypothetical protein BDP27DRAFT_1218561 [Rhodocollybia butyracea]|uniref:Uncharacterized protein n=1 Tax=Rhodocollybia butyracea TaxID=206335 RepID=A0A9P5PYY7_9AGAR|nr:hypothetical protein BDP27DRAFT_1218561 [Rhodocollybia butyracea]